MAATRRSERNKTAMAIPLSILALGVVVAVVMVIRAKGKSGYLKMN